jgi:hypothetical protein
MALNGYMYMLARSLMYYKYADGVQECQTPSEGDHKGHISHIYSFYNYLECQTPTEGDHKGH